MLYNVRSKLAQITVFCVFVLGAMVPMVSGAQVPNTNTSPVPSTNPTAIPNSNPSSDSGSLDRCEGSGLCNPLASDSLEDFLLAIIRILRIFAVPIIIFMIIYAGFLYVLARGSEEQVTKATRALTYAVVGGLLILGAELILRVIQGTVDQLTGL